MYENIYLITVYGSEKFPKCFDHQELKFDDQ